MDLREKLIQDCKTAVRLADKADERDEDFVLVDVGLLYRLANTLALLLGDK